MAGPSEIPELHVEGNDDLHSIANLLVRHGVDMSEAARPLRIVAAGDVSKLLEKMPVAIAAATSRPVGFVVDVDIPLGDRWKAVQSKLREAKVNAADTCPQTGFLAKREGYPQQVGVWLMPDCGTDGGTLEHLLETLIPKADKLWPFAQRSTRDAAELGAEFTGAHRRKAAIHCWLAWQRVPGVPFGTAINNRYFSHNSPEASAFLHWMRALFDLKALSDL